MRADSLPFHVAVSQESQSAPAEDKKNGVFFMVEAVTRRSVNS